jgi:hypothetical protein
VELLFLYRLRHVSDVIIVRNIIHKKIFFMSTAVGYGKSKGKAQT